MPQRVGPTSVKSSILRCVNQLSRVAFVSFAFYRYEFYSWIRWPRFSSERLAAKSGISRFRQKTPKVAFCRILGPIGHESPEYLLWIGRFQFRPRRPYAQDTNNVKNYIPNFTHGRTDYIAEARGVLAGLGLSRILCLYATRCFSSICAHHLGSYG